MPFPAFLIPLLAQGAGTALGFKGKSLPRIDLAPARKAMAEAGAMPSASTVMQRGRGELTEQAGLARSQISRIARDMNMPTEAMRTITERAQPHMYSTYIQGMGRVYGQALTAQDARARAMANAAQLMQSGQTANTEIEMREEEMRPNPLETGAMFGQLAGNIMNIKSMQDYVKALEGIYGSGAIFKQTIRANGSDGRAQSTIAYTC